MRARRVRACIAAVAIFAVPVAACGDDDEEVEAQPGPNVTTFVEGNFDALPIPPLADPASARDEEDDVAVRSYVIRDRTPENVLEFYREALADAATVVSAPSRSAKTWEGEWRLADGSILRVTALPAPAADGGEFDDDVEVLTQFSLMLRSA